MRFLADENVDARWIRALVGDGHEVIRVPDVPELSTGAPDAAVVDAAIGLDCVVLTADQSDFADPPRDDHAGIVVVPDVNRSGGEVARAVRTLEESGYDIEHRVAFLSDWL